MGCVRIVTLFRLSCRTRASCGPLGLTASLQYSSWTRRDQGAHPSTSRRHRVTTAARGSVRWLISDLRPFRSRRTDTAALAANRRTASVAGVSDRKPLAIALPSLAGPARPSKVGGSRSPPVHLHLAPPLLEQRFPAPRVTPRLDGGADETRAAASMWLAPFFFGSPGCRAAPSAIAHIFRAAGVSRGRLPPARGRVLRRTRSETSALTDRQT